MTSQPILAERDGAILTVTLNLPEKRNPVSDPAVIAGLEEVLRAADADIGVRAVILTGGGPPFRPAAT